MIWIRKNMLEIVKSKRFKKAYKKISQSKNFKREIFLYVVAELVLGRKLPKKFKDHALSGDLIGFRECHLAPDILLIYEIDNEVLILTLINIGSHSNLFK